MRCCAKRVKNNCLYLVQWTTRDRGITISRAFCIFVGVLCSPNRSVMWFPFSYSNHQPKEFKKEKGFYIIKDRNFLFQYVIRSNRWNFVILFVDVNIIEHYFGGREYRRRISIHFTPTFKSIYLLTIFFIYSSIFLSICLSIYLSIYLSIFSFI